MVFFTNKNKGGGKGKQKGRRGAGRPKNAISSTSFVRPGTRKAQKPLESPSKRSKRTHTTLVGRRTKQLSIPAKFR